MYDLFTFFLLLMNEGFVLIHFPPFLCLAPCFHYPIACFWIQADVETDEVYAQMTLQPLNAV